MASKMTPEEVVKAWNEVYSQPDPVGATKFMTADFKRYGDTTNYEPIGIDRWLKGQGPFFLAFPDWHWEMRSIQSKDNTVICEFEEHGTFINPWNTPLDFVVEPNGKSYQDRSAIWFVVNDDGLISELRAYYTDNMERVYGFRKTLDEYRRANGAGW
jgi:hypothetical protein